MRDAPFQALQAAARSTPRPSAARNRLVIAGATGVLGNEVLRRLVGQQQFASTQVLAREPITAGLRGVGTTLVPADDPAQWPPGAADTGVVLFDPPRLFYERERALWTPTPQQLPALARWMHRSGVGTLAVVLPHSQGRLPDSLKRGLATLDEQAIASIGFERLLIVRSAHKPKGQGARGLLPGLAHWLLSVSRYMVPDREQPVRSPMVAEFVATALQLAPPGIHIAASELVWAAAQGDVRKAARDWLAGESG
jgi:hypothetical protein